MADGQSPVENLVMLSARFWKNKRVLVTGHTGFKGSWLCLWLALLGAKVTGYALKPPTSPNLFSLAGVGELLEKSIIADLHDLTRLQREVKKARPEIIFHLAAQPIVRDSYKVPVATYNTNVLGTVHLLEAVRRCPGARAVVNVTTDKCYENEDLKKAFKENAPLGGHDPYSSSKACSELVTAAYRRSYFAGRVGVATARAGNVIGGGDWGNDRLVPDFIRAILQRTTLKVRNPGAVRPWQHVLEPLSGYLILAEKLFLDPKRYAEAWNFGPNKKDAKPVAWLVKQLCQKWGEGAQFKIDQSRQPHEAGYLRLDFSKAQKRLGWQPKWPLIKALDKVVEWTRAYRLKDNLREICWLQIEEYVND